MTGRDRLRAARKAGEAWASGASLAKDPGEESMARFPGEDGYGERAVFCRAADRVTARRLEREARDEA